MAEIQGLIEYYRYNSDTAALFTTRRKRMSYHYVRNILRQIGARAGVPRFHAHAARHWCAIALLRGIFGHKPLDICMVQIRAAPLYPCPDSFLSKTSFIFSSPRKNFPNHFCTWSATSSWETCVYLWVVLSDLCPRWIWTYLMSKISQ